jgi:hypothetical protein
MVTVGSSSGTRPPNAFSVTLRQTFTDVRAVRYSVVHGEVDCRHAVSSMRATLPQDASRHDVSMKALTRAGLAISINVTVLMLCDVRYRTRYGRGKPQEPAQRREREVLATLRNHRAEHPAEARCTQSPRSGRHCRPAATCSGALPSQLSRPCLGMPSLVR